MPITAPCRTRVRCPKADGCRHARRKDGTAAGTLAVDKLDIHWDVRANPAGGLGLERQGGKRVHLSALSADAKSAARSRLGKIGDVVADCKRVRDCWEHAPAAVRDLVDPQVVYSARACAGMAASVCRGQERAP